MATRNTLRFFRSHSLRKRRCYRRAGRPLRLVPLLLFGSCLVAQAQPLTLEQAVAQALERAPQLEARSAALEAAQAESIAAGRLPDPQLMLGIDNLPVTGADAWSLDRDFMTMRRVGVMQAFPNRRKRASQRDLAAAAVSVARRRAEQARLEIARAASDAWIAAHTAAYMLQQLRVLEPEVTLQAEAARAGLASDRGSTVDAIAAQAAISELDDRIFEAQSGIAAARAELARWIGEDAHRELAAMPDFHELPVARERLQASLHRHASLLAIDAQLALAQSEIDLARAGKRPDWSAELAYADRGEAFSDMISIEFRVDLPLFGRYRQDPTIRAKRAGLAQLEAQREAQLRMHAAELTRMLAAWDASRKRLDLYESERLPLARQRSRAALSAYQFGRSELADVLASHAHEIELQQGYAALTRTLGQAWTYLRYLEAGQESS